MTVTARVFLCLERPHSDVLRLDTIGGSTEKAKLLRVFVPVPRSLSVGMPPSDGSGRCDA